MDLGTVGKVMENGWGGLLLGTITTFLQNRSAQQAAAQNPLVSSADAVGVNLDEARSQGGYGLPLTGNAPGLQTARGAFGGDSSTSVTLGNVGRALAADAGKTADARGKQREYEIGVGKNLGEQFSTRADATRGRLSEAQSQGEAGIKGGFSMARGYLENTRDMAYQLLQSVPRMAAGMGQVVKNYADIAIRAQGEALQQGVDLTAQQTANYRQVVKQASKQTKVGLSDEMRMAGFSNQEVSLMEKAVDATYFAPLMDQVKEISAANHERLTAQWNRAAAAIGTTASNLGATLASLASQAMTSQVSAGQLALASEQLLASQAVEEGVALADHRLNLEQMHTAADSLEASGNIAMAGFLRDVVSLDEIEMLTGPIMGYMMDAIVGLGEEQNIIAQGNFMRSTGMSDQFYSGLMNSYGLFQSTQMQKDQLAVQKDQVSAQREGNWLGLAGDVAGGAARVGAAVAKPDTG